MDGLEVALMRLKEDAAGWKAVSVRHFDEDFGEYVDVTDDDVIAGRVKYEVALEPTDNAALPEGNLFVKSLTGKTTTVTLLSRNGAVNYAGVKVTDSVVQLKRYIERIEGVEVDEQRLAYEGKQLEDHRSLQSYGIGNNARIFFMHRLRGC